VRYEVRLAPLARPQLNTLSETVAAAVLNFLDGPLAENPHRVGKALLNPLDGLHSARRGSDRVLYRIEDEPVVVTVIKIDHRRDVYRPS
jgi:mRNA-degrading endonuclease RelE of RelBE toxin-antitoxin system